MMNLVQGDCLEKMKEIPDGSVDLVVMDPPYNIGKSKEWDKFKSADYLDFMASVFSECQRVLTDNGQMYFFHNDIEAIAELMQYLRNNTGFIFSAFITLPKYEHRRLIWKRPSEAVTLKNWFNICEYALMYIKGKDAGTVYGKSSWDKVRLNVNNFSNLRRYAYEMLLFIGGALLTEENRLNGISDTEKRSTSSTARRAVTTARRRVFSDVGGKADHFMRFGSTQWTLPTPEVYRELTERYNLRNWDGFREYEDLKREYEDEQPVHNKDNEHSNVWIYKWGIKREYHPCEKPVEILERMIRTSSKPGAVILDPFMGSGSTGVACVNTGRQFIGIEKDAHYFEVACERIKRAEEQALACTE